MILIIVREWDARDAVVVVVKSSGLLVNYKFSFVPFVLVEHQKVPHQYRELYSLESTAPSVLPTKKSACALSRIIMSSWFSIGDLFLLLFRYLRLQSEETRLPQRTTDPALYRFVDRVDGTKFTPHLKSKSPFAGRFRRYGQMESRRYGQLNASLEHKNYYNVRSKS